MRLNGVGLLYQYGRPATGHRLQGASRLAKDIATPNGQYIYRRFISHSSVDQQGDNNQYKAIVVGGGPAGIATVGNLLETGVKPILWVDRKFDGGRLNRCYREVPSNTKVALFLDFAKAVSPFRQVVQSTPEPNAYSTLMGLKQDVGCRLKYAADLCVMLTKGLDSQMGVEKVPGSVKTATLDDLGKWHVTLEGGRPTADEQSHSHHQNAATLQATTPLLVLSTGSSPIEPALPRSFPHLKVLDLDLCLSPSQLKAKLSPSEPATVALVGASHSAILILRALYDLASTSHPNLQIFWFSRHKLRYAENKGDWILRDNTGLKGEAADWAKKMVEDDTFDHSGASKYIKKIRASAGRDEKKSYTDFLPLCSHLVEAVGYAKDPLPSLRKRVREGNVKESKDVSFEELRSDGTSGGFVDIGGVPVPGLKGVGIAFPEKVTDPEGNVEWAVGMWKFMKYLKKVVPEWVTSEGRNRSRE